MEMRLMQISFPFVWTRSRGSSIPVFQDSRTDQAVLCVASPWLHMPRYGMSLIPRKDQPLHLVVKERQTVVWQCHWPLVQRVQKILPRLCFLKQNDGCSCHWGSKPQSSWAFLVMSTVTLALELDPRAKTSMLSWKECYILPVQRWHCIHCTEFSL